MRKPRSEYPSEQADKFLLRFPDGMRDLLKAEAEVNKRSMNAEIVSRLEQSLGLHLPVRETSLSLEDFEKLSAAFRRVAEISEEYGAGTRIRMTIEVPDVAPADEPDRDHPNKNASLSRSKKP